MDSLLDRLSTQAKAGVKSGEEELLRYLSVRFHALAKRRVNEGDAEDMAQEACFTVLEKYKTATYSKGFSAWAYKILRNKIGNYLRSKNNMKPEPDIEHVMNTSSVQPDCNLKRMLVRCFQQLVKRNRGYARVLNLVHQGYRTDEICKKLRITPNNLYVTLSRGRLLLKSCLERGRM